MAVAPDFRLGVVAADERIVRRHRAVRRDAHDLAEMVGEVLRLVAIGEVIAHREQQIAVAALHDAAAEMIAARQRAFLAEDHLHVVELGASPSVSRARAIAVRPPPRCGLGEAEIDRPVRREVAVEHDVVQSALAGARTCGTPATGGDSLPSRVDDAQAAGPLGDQHRRRAGRRAPTDDRARARPSRRSDCRRLKERFAPTPASHSTAGEGDRAIAASSANPFACDPSIATRKYQKSCAARAALMVTASARRRSRGRARASRSVRAGCSVVRRALRRCAGTAKPDLVGRLDIVRLCSIQPSTVPVPSVTVSPGTLAKLLGNKGKSVKYG